MRQKNYDWDQLLKDEEALEASRLMQNFREQTVSFPRYIAIGTDEEIHVFADASGGSYAAVA